MPRSWTRCLFAKGTVANVPQTRGDRDAERTVHQHLIISTAPPPHPARHMYFRALNIKLLRAPAPSGFMCESWPLAGLMHNDRPGLGRTEQMPSRHTRLAAPRHKTQPLAI